MFFSFFKKRREKMVAKPAAVPRARDSGGTPAEEVQPDSVSPREENVAVSLPAAPVAETEARPFSEFVFSEKGPDFHVEVDIDPVDARVEEAAVLFANAQDAAARVALESAVREFRSGAGERLWLMLFDLYRLLGQKSAFEALGLDYARAFEKSPPGWCDKSDAQAGGKAKPALAGSVLFKGDLVGANAAGFAAIAQSLERSPKLRLDLAKVTGFDAPGCAMLLDLLQRSRKAGREIELLGRDALGALLEKSIVPGRAEGRECWLLLLEILQLQGRQEAFEDMAINYAVTFEVSPPSWEPARVAAPEPEQKALAANGQAAGAEAYALRGEIRGSRFGDLAAYVAGVDTVLIDCSGLNRMDFVSAGALLNVLTPIRRTGKHVVFRHANHLVGELFTVIGLSSVATLIFAKH